MKTCSMHGPVNFTPEQYPAIAEGLREAVYRAYQDGFRRFLCTFAHEIDLMFSGYVSELRGKNSRIVMEGLLTGKNQLLAPPGMGYYLSRCDTFYISGHKSGKNSHMRKNQYMLSQSDRIILITLADEEAQPKGFEREIRKRGRDVREVVIGTAQVSVHSKSSARGGLECVSDDSTGF